jgi:hypothetical protein
VSNNVLTEYRVEMGITLLLVFGLASLIGILGASTNNNLTGFWSTFQSIVESFGNWVYWLAFIGPLGFLCALWWMADYILKVKKLKNLIDTESKAKFIKNQDDIEYIAWRLPKKYKVLVAKKKIELKIS